MKVKHCNNFRSIALDTTVSVAMTVQSGSITFVRSFGQIVIKYKMKSID